SIPVPETAALGLTRMRVIMEFISVSGSCTNTRNGETEDYCLRIIENPGCVAPNWIQAEYFTEDEMVILTWAASAGPGGEYLVRYRPLESTEWTEITTTELSLSLSDFPLCELYEVEIASLCDDEPGAFLRTVFNSCSSTSTPNLFTNSWAIFPNPAQKELNIKWSDGNPTISEWEVFDALGRRRLAQVPSRSFSSQIDVSTLPAGIYFLRIELEDGRHGVKRLIKQ
ncbi:MAG: T9SS type A sorting domain-containing protein, partial [Bacteroidota bacterium]